MDKHAEARDAHRQKERYGMAVKGRSLLTVARTIEKKAEAARADRAGRESRETRA